MPKQVISTPKVAKSSLPLSQATLAGNLVFIGGAVAMNERGEIVGKGDIKAQTRQALENMKAIVETAGGSLRDVTRTTVFLTDLSNYNAMNEVYRSYFSSEPPARATVRVDLANPEFLIEIEAMAVLA